MNAEKHAALGIMQRQLWKYNATVGTFQAAEDGWCLNLGDCKTADGTRVDLFPWIYDGGGGGGGGAVSSRDTSSEHFALNASSCNGANLKWAYSKDAQHIVSMYSHKCLEANTSSGAGQMLQNSCDPNTLTQKWLVSPEVFSPGGAGGTIVLVSAGTDGGTGAHEGSRWNATSMCLSSFQCPAAGC